ncbi:carboxypeptidase-like regulatory domain-containing protein [Dehalococcoidia bacterium]|nr:carboxypeptidase-like regulatory domain-containing protein [Dehalococcoidia bacterium]
MRTLGMLALGLGPILAIWVATSPVYGESETTTVSGHITNGTAGSIPPSDGVSVQLHVYRANSNDTESLTTVTDSNGRYTIDRVPIDNVTSYMISTTHLGLSYHTTLSPEDNLTDIELLVYQSTSNLDQVFVVGNTLIILGIEETSKTVSIMEIVAITNDGDRVFVPDITQNRPMGFLRFPLPPGAINLDIQSELPASEVLQVDRGFALTTAVAPGEHGVAFTYSVPYPGNTLDLSRTFLRGADMFRLLALEGIGSIASSDMVDMGNTTVGNSIFRLLQATSLPAGTLIEVTLQDLPEPALLHRLQIALDSQSVATIPIAVLAVGLILFMVVGLRKTKSTDDTSITVSEKRQMLLIKAIDSLENRFRHGELDPLEYARQHRILKALSLRSGWQEEHM